MVLTDSFWETQAFRAQQAKKAVHVVNEIHSSYGIPKKTAWRKIKEYGYHSGRKTRSDAGVIPEELKNHLYAVANLYHRKRKRESKTPLERAVELYVDACPEAKDILPSTSHIHSLFRKLGLSRRHIKAPTPKLEIKCKFPNHVHFLDSSICRYYISKKNNILFIPTATNYKNKPDRYVSKQVLVRNIIIDGCSGAYFVWYSTTQTALDWTDFLFNAWKYKEDFLFHGVPYVLIMDNDAALRSYAFLKLLNYLQVKVPDVEPYHPWVKGYVEQIHDSWERWFESGFMFLEKKVADLDLINQWAYDYSIRFQSTRKHSRHGMTRFDAWQKGIQEHLRELPDYHTYRKLFHFKPETRTVKSNGKFLYYGEYKLTDTELFGKKVDVIKYPYEYQKNKAVTVVYPSSKENPRNFLLPENEKKVYTVIPIQKDNYGYNIMSHPWEEYKGLKHTASMNNQKEVEKVEIPEIKPFKTPEPSMIHMPVKGEQIEVKPDYEPREIEYTKTFLKMQLVKRLHRSLSQEESDYIANLGKETFKEEDIQALEKLFRVQKVMRG